MISEVTMNSTASQNTTRHRPRRMHYSTEKGVVSGLDDGSAWAEPSTFGIVGVGAEVLKPERRQGGRIGTAAIALRGVGVVDEVLGLEWRRRQRGIGDDGGEVLGLERKRSHHGKSHDSLKRKRETATGNHLWKLWYMQ